MNETNNRELYLEEINRIHSNTDTRSKEKISSLYSLYKTIISDALESEEQYFSNDFARLIFLADKFPFPDELTADLRLLRYVGRKISSLDAKYDTKNYAFSLKVIFKLLETLYQIKPNDEIYDFLAKYESSLPFGASRKDKTERISFVSAVVRDKGQVYQVKGKNHAEVFCSSDDIGDFTLLVSDIWFDIVKMVWKNALLNIFEIKKVSKEKEIYATSINSLIILEPDYLIDVTDIADCFQNSGANIYLYFLKRYLKGRPSLPMVAGNIINSCFDELLDNSEADFQTIYYNALRIKPLQVFSIVKDNPNNAKYLKEIVLRQFLTLKEVIKSFNGGILSAEPSFISPVFGLQGRLDLLIEYEDQPNRKDIVELKSGKAPSPDLTITTESGFRIKSGLWHNHLIQTTCYNLLLDSAFDDRTGSSQILYSHTDIFPLRNAENIIGKKQEALLYRNWIIALEMTLLKGHYSLLDSLNPDDFGAKPSYMNQDIIDFANAYKSASQIERNYFQQFTSFISKEIYSSKCGFDSETDHKGFSSLWKSSPLEKELSYLIIPQLKLISEESDFDNLHLLFEVENSTNAVSAFRKGDMGILYPYRKESDYDVYKQQIIKCHIKDINSGKIKLSIRNKLFRRDILFDNEYFTFEPDYIDSTGKALFSSLYAFFSSSKTKKELILGLKEPEFADIEFEPREELTDEQNELLKSSLSAKDYFLIQGPPGTGKTSYMLRSIVESIYNDSEETILITAYTNRAVDEICSSLKRSKSDIPFIRLGNKESSVHTENLLSRMAEDHDIKELYNIVNNARVVVSTTSSLLSNREIFDIKDFDTIIIDEASQILEPQIVGLIVRADRFIMIGDEKQMPAVVVQKETYDSTRFPDLESISLMNLSGSLFERLLANCINNNWHNCYGMLSYQARMVEPIQALANDLFYQGKLQRLIIAGADTIQKSNELPDPMKNNALIFIESIKENNFKTNRGEASMAASLALKYHDLFSDGFNENTIGIISPYRAQCSLIKSMLDDRLDKMISVDTVERYQGSERDVIIISLAVNERYQLKNMQSITEINGEILDRKLNVAITRAKKHLIILGCPEVIEYSDVYKKMLVHFRSNGLVLTQSHFEQMD